VSSHPSCDVALRALGPDNPASKRVLEKVGFRHEGLALRYLRLAGRWTDQELSAITAEDELRGG